MVNLLLLLLIIHIALFIHTVLANKGKLISPSAIYFMSWIVMLALGFAFSAELEMTISIKTFWIILISSALFYLVEFFFMGTKGRLKGNYTEQANNEWRQEIKIKSTVLWIILIINVFYLMLSLYSVFSSTGNGSFPARMNSYKTAILFGTGKVRFQFLIAQLFKIKYPLAHGTC